MPVVWTDGRSIACSVYDHVITKFSGKVGYHISSAMGLRPRARLARGWSSAINNKDDDDDDDDDGLGILVISLDSQGYPGNAFARRF